MINSIKPFHFRKMTVTSSADNHKINNLGELIFLVHELTHNFPIHFFLTCWTNLIWLHKMSLLCSQITFILIFSKYNQYLVDVFFPFLTNLLICSTEAASWSCEREVTLERVENKSFGISIVGGKVSSSIQIKNYFLHYPQV